jgi:hypothetical protein
LLLAGSPFQALMECQACPLTPPKTLITAVAPAVTHGSTSSDGNTWWLTPADPHSAPAGELIPPQYRYGTKLAWASKYTTSDPERARRTADRVRAALLAPGCGSIPAFPQRLRSAGLRPIPMMACAVRFLPREPVPPPRSSTCPRGCGLGTGG